MSDGKDSPTARGPDDPAEEHDQHSGGVVVSHSESFDRLEYHPDTRSYRTVFDAAADAPSFAVVAAVAAVTGVEITDLTPLHGEIDPDALDKLWNSGHESSGTSEVSFTFVDHRVTLSGDGGLAISPSLRGDDFPDG